MKHLVYIPLHIYMVSVINLWYWLLSSYYYCTGRVHVHSLLSRSSPHNKLSKLWFQYDSVKIWNWINYYFDLWAYYLLVLIKKSQNLRTRSVFCGDKTYPTPNSFTRLQVEHPCFLLGSRGKIPKAEVDVMRATCCSPERICSCRIVQSWVCARVWRGRGGPRASLMQQVKRYAIVKHMIDVFDAKTYALLIHREVACVCDIAACAHSLPLASRLWGRRLHSGLASESKGNCVWNESVLRQHSNDNAWAGLLIRKESCVVVYVSTWHQARRASMCMFARATHSPIWRCAAWILCCEVLSIAEGERLGEMRMGYRAGLLVRSFL